MGLEPAGFEMTLEEERERLLKDALEECRKKGVSHSSFLTLQHETGYHLNNERTA